MKLVDDTFAPGGPIARALPGFEAREGQVRMSRLIQRGFLENVHSIVEAGTGVGKSLAYLVPALQAGARVVVSTGTIALQEQLVRKDIPLVTKALGIEARVVLLKGRNHYLCRAKFEKESGARLIAPSVALERLWAWAERTETGDRAELDFTPRADDWETLDADADDCVGEYCSRFADCHFFAKRDAARFADVVVVNHALFFLDLASGGALLPAYDFVVLDEAHQAEKYATAALTATLSPVSVNRMMRKVHRTYAVPGAFDAELDEGMRRLQQTLAQVPGDKYPIAANEGVFDVLPALRESFYRLENWLHANWKDGLRRPIDNEAEAERRRDLALRSVAAHVATVDRIENAALQAANGELPADEIENVAWVERGEGGERYEVNAAPFSVAEFLRATLFARTRSVVLTSATISTGGSFEFLKSSLGIDEAQQLVAPSPFDYAKQARLYIAPPRLNPKAADFAQRAAPLIEEILDRSGGRAFVLFTSYARLREVYALLRERIPFPSKMQGDLPRTALLDWFRSTRSAVLFATGTFWEGIDVVGDALSCVVIDRLPFPSPSEPLVAARIAALEAKGRSGFEHYMIPSAIVRLKQGFGRLIRSTSDRGVVALLDGRATSMRYGATIVDALPPATRITDLAALDDLFREV
jgi:ATP-dependent DNA helicase DinG